MTDAPWPAALGEQHAQRVEVGTSVDRVPAGLFGGNVIDRPHNYPGGGQSLTLAHPAGQPEVDQQCAAGDAVEEDIGRLDIAMDQPGVVSSLQAGQALLNQPDSVPDGQSFLPLQPSGQRFPVDELHGEEMTPAVLSNEVDRDHVGVRDLRGRGCFGMETADEILVPSQLRGEHFDGHRAVERVVVAPVHIAHAAAADPAENAEMSQPCKRQSLFAFSVNRGRNGPVAQRRRVGGHAGDYAPAWRRFVDGRYGVRG